MQRIDLACSQEQFRRVHFERRPLFMPRSLNTSGYGWDDVSREFFGIDPSDPRLRFFMDGEPLRADHAFMVQDGDFMRSFYRPGAVEDLLGRGASLVISRFDRSSLLVSALCQELARFVDERCVGNAYIAQGGGGTFGRHWDRHCVFALQLLGRKHWKVYAPSFELPLEFQSSADHKDDCPAVPVFDGELVAGDVLYIPRGWWHEALPIPGEPTLHIAAGIHTTSVHDYLGWLAATQAPKLLSARASIPHTGGAEAFSPFAAALQAEILSESNLQDFKASQMKIARAQEPVRFERLFCTSTANDDIHHNHHTREISCAS